MLRRSWVRGPLLFTVAALLLGACGDDDDGGDGAIASGCLEPLAPASEAENPAGIEGVQACTPDSREHTEGQVAYTETPPVGGAHFPQWQSCGFYDEEVPAEEVVHSLEHGAVWITYRDGLDDAGQDALQGLVNENDFVLASVYPDLPTPVVASAWGLQLRLDSAGDPRLAEFVDAYAEGPQTPEPGAPC